MKAKIKKLNTIRNLSARDRMDILKRVAANESIRGIAAYYNIRYASIRNIVMSEWERLFPKHFAKSAAPRTVKQFRKNPPSFPAP